MWSNAMKLHILNIKEKDQINLWLTQFGSPSAVNSILICDKSQRRRKNVVVPFMCTTIEMCCSTKFTILWLCLGLWYMLYWLFLETIRARYSRSNMHKVILIPHINNKTFLITKWILFLTLNIEIMVRDIIKTKIIT